MAPLAPFNPPLGPNVKFCVPQETTLHMKEKVFSLTGDDFTVKTTAGVEVCKCKGKVLSISDKKSRLMSTPTWSPGPNQVYKYQWPTRMIADREQL